METYATGTLEDLRAFCAVVELGTVTAAARTLHETKGALSRRLSRLETRMGVALLARHPRAVSPTEEGLAFYAKAREALALLDDALQDAHQARQLPAGHLRVTAPLDIGIELLPALISAFRLQHPQITIELLITDAALDLAAHRIDLAIRAAVDPLPDMGYHASRLAQLRLQLYAAPAYLARRGAPPSLQALVEHDVLRAHDHSPTLRIHDRLGRLEQVAVRVAVRSSDYASLLRLCLAGAGIALLPDRIAAAAVAQASLQPLFADCWESRATLYAVSLGGREAPARVRVFREFLRARL